LHNGKGHQVVIVGGANCAQQIQDNRRPPFKKTVKSPYICNRLMDFDEIWHDDAYLPLTKNRQLKFQIFENPRWLLPPFSKNHNNRDISATV